MWVIAAISVSMIVLCITVGIARNAKILHDMRDEWRESTKSLGWHD